MKPCHLLMLLATATLLAGCGQHLNVTEKNDSLARQIGRPCRIQFRRDALGLAGTHPVSPNADEKQGVEVEIRGTLTALDGEYLIVRQDTTVTWVPQSSVLLVRFDESD